MKVTFPLPITHRASLYLFSDCITDNCWISHLLDTKCLTELTLHLVRSIFGRLSQLSFLFLDWFFFLITLG